MLLVVLPLFIITITTAIDINYYILFNGAQNKTSLEFDTNISIYNNNNEMNVYDVMKLAVDEQGNGYQFTAKYYQDLGYFVKCIASVCMNNDFYWSFWLNGKYSCIGLSHIILNTNNANTNIDMIYSNPNITCSSSLNNNLDINNRNKNFRSSINVSYEVIFGTNLVRSAIISSTNYTMKGIEVMEHAVDHYGNAFSFTTIYYNNFGDFIDCIDGICCNEDTNEYWFLYLNNNQTMNGITFITVGNGDKLTFVYEKYQKYKHGTINQKHFRTN